MVISLKNYDHLKFVLSFTFHGDKTLSITTFCLTTLRITTKGYDTQKSIKKSA